MTRVALAVAVSFIASFAAVPVAAAQPVGPHRPPATSTTPKALTPASISAGGVWNWQNPLPNGNSFFAISCPSTSTCFAAGEDGPILTTSNGGATWTQQQSVLGVFGLNCASTTSCVGVGFNGEVLTTSNGGSSWQTQDVGGGIQYLLGISCPTTSVCYASGAAGNVFKSSDGGVTWAPLVSGTTSNLFGISCISATTCWVVGDGGLIRKTADGSTWSPETSSVTTGLEAISCDGTLGCTAVGQGGMVVTTTTTRSTWVASQVTSNNVGFTGISCPTATTLCVATASDGNTYTGFGLSYGAASVSEPGFLWSASCPSATVCFVAGDHGIIATTTVAGTGWSAQSPPVLTNPPSYQDIDCANTSICVAVGSETAVTADAGHTWAHHSFGQGQLYSVSCPSTTTCVAVGLGAGGSALVLGTTDSGLTWPAQSPGVSTRLSGVSCPSTSVCFAVGDGGVIIGTVDGGAHWTSETSGTPDAVAGISCPSTTVCFAIVNHLSGSGSVLQTTDGGAHWSDVKDQTQIRLAAISCVDLNTCVAAGDSGAFVDMLQTSDGGISWDHHGVLIQNDFLTDVSCSSTTTCVASGAFFLTTNDGSTWTAPPPPPNSGYDAVSCPSTTTCFAAGPDAAIVRTTDAGSTWLRAFPAGTNDNLTGVSCPTSTTCFAAGYGPNGLSADVYKTNDGGALWSQVFSLPGGAANPGCTAPTVCSATPDRLTCPSSTECVGVGNTCCNGAFVFRTADGGATWSTVNVGVINNPTGISCPSTAVCVLSDSLGTVMASPDGGASWHAPVTVTSAGLTGISCPSTTLCFATDGGSPGKIYVSTTGGSSWALSFDLSTDPQAGPGGAFRSIDCPTTTTCDAVGLKSEFVTTNDGGQNWRTDNFTRVSDIADVSCPSAGTCFAASGNSQIFTTSEFGSAWEGQFAGLTPAGGEANLTAVSCPSATSCFAVGDGGLIVATATGGVAWSRSSPTGTTEFVSSISCPDSSDCYGAAASSGFNDGTILVSHNGGSSWSQHATNSGDEVNSMSCPSANTCFAVGWPATIYRSIDSGTTWTYEPNPMSSEDRSFGAVSCTSTTNCTVVGVEGQILTTADGTNWSGQSSPTTKALFAVDCHSACVAVGAGGTVLYQSSGSWHLGTSGTTNQLFGVSCASSSVCYAVGAAGTVLTTTNAGVSWKAQTSGVTNPLSGIDCTGFSVCVAVGANGTAIYTLDGKTWTTASVPTGNGLGSVALLSSGKAWIGGSGGTILENTSAFSAPAPTVTGVLAAAGPLFGESVVTISGTGFTGGVSAVSFGGTAAPAFNVVNDTTLTATTPAHAVGAVDVTVTTLGGTSATSTADQFTYEQPYVYTSVAPQRLLDTRSSHNTLGPGGHIDLAIGGVTVPAGTRAVVLNVTAVDESTAGYFTVFPTGGVVPVASNLNWVAGETVPNLVTVGLGTGGDVTIFNGLGTADAVVDLQGYYAPTSGSSLGEYVPVVPARITDTRPGSGQTNAGLTLGPGATLNVQVTGAGGIPATGVTAVALNVTATDTTSAGFFTVFPTGGTAPLASNLNWTAGVTVPNRVIVKVGTGGKISVFNGLGRADLIVDVNGYFTDATLTGATFVPVSPTRIVDTRNGTGGFSSPVGPAGTITVPVAGAGGVPRMSASTPPQAVVLNVTVTGPTQAGYLIIFPDGASRPLASDLNFAAGQTVPNLVIVKLSPGGNIDIFNGLGSTHVIVDVVGWYG